MNKYRDMVAAIGEVLTADERAAWLAHYEDGLPLYQIANEWEGTVQGIPLTRVWELINEANYKLVKIAGDFAKAFDEPEKPDLPVAVNGFHQMGDGENG